MGLLVSGNTATVRVVARVGVQAAINVLHFSVTASTGSGVTEAEAAEALDDTWHDEYKAVMSILTSYRGVSVQKDGGTPPGVPFAHVGNYAEGAVAGNLMPTQVTGLIAWRTALTGHANRGRSYIPFPSASDSTAGDVPTADYVTRLGTLAAAIIGPHVLVGGGGTATLKLAVRQAGGGHNLVTSFVARPKFGTQRRRGAFGRPNDSPF